MNIRRVVVIYSHKDRLDVEVIIKHLRYKGIEVWYDEALEGGKDWFASVLKNIEASDYVLLMLSEDALKSEFVASETRYAALQGVVRDKDGFLLPVLLKECKPSAWLAKKTPLRL